MTLMYIKPKSKRVDVLFKEYVRSLNAEPNNEENSVLLS
jgi:hypothetical protein